MLSGNTYLAKLTWYCIQAEQEGDFGEGMQTVDLLPEGATCPVTDDNKQLYVDLYMQHLLDNSIAPQFDAFQRGFKKVRLQQLDMKGFSVVRMFSCMLTHI